MKFLLVPSSVMVMCEYRAMVDFAAAIRQCGHEATVAAIKRPGAYHDMDVVIEINQSRHEMVHPRAIHIAWVQDYIHGNREQDYDGDCQPQDLIYTFGDPELMGLPYWGHHVGSLLYATKPELLGWHLMEPDLDFSIAAHIAKPVEFEAPGGEPMPGTQFVVTLEVIFKQIAEELEKTYKPLCGAGYHQKDKARAYEIIERLVTATGLPITMEDAWRQIEVQISHFTFNYVRMMDCREAARQMLLVSKDVVLQGFNWEDWPDFNKYAVGYCQDLGPLLDLYQRSRINVHNNVYGFAIHSRVLEAMAVGGFVMANVSPHHGKLGQMTESFWPGYHYGEYDAKNFRDVATYWLKDKEARVKATVEARKVVKAKHLWDHRAKQVLRDLGVRSQ